MPNSVNESLVDACLELINELEKVGIISINRAVTRDLLDITTVRRVFDRSKREAIAEFAAGAGHEINNPAATIAGRVTLLLKNEQDPEKRRALETIGGQAYRIRDMIGDAMAFGRPSEPRPTNFRPGELVQRYVSEIGGEIHSKGFDVSLDVDTAIEVFADEQQFQVVLAALIRNVFEAGESAGSVALLAIKRSVGRSGFVEFVVSNSGRVLEQSEVEKYLEPFFSGRPAGRGLGFGLSKCWQIVELNKGEIELHAPATGGFVVTTYWPEVPVVE